MNIKSLKNKCFVNLELKNDRLTDWNGKCLSWVECWTDPGQIRMQKSFWTKAFLSVCCFYVFFGFQFLVFGDFGFHLSKCVSLLASFLFWEDLVATTHDPPSLLNKSFLFASHVSHTVSLLIPALKEFICSLQLIKSVVSVSSVPPLQLKIIIWFQIPPLRSAVLSILSILPLSLLPPLIHLCIFLASEDFSGEAEKERDEIRDGSDREMALVERRGCKFRFLKLL